VKLVRNAAGPGWDLLTAPGSSHYNAMAAPTHEEDEEHDGRAEHRDVREHFRQEERRRSFPRVFIASRIGYQGFAILDTVLGRSSGLVTNSSGSGRVIALTLGVGVWALYFWKSQRVRATFVHGPRARAAEIDVVVSDAAAPQ
jgi:hypothetical protein